MGDEALHRPRQRARTNADHQISFAPMVRQRADIDAHCRPAPLAFNLFLLGDLESTISVTVAAATVAAFLGMWLGQHARTRLNPQAFRRLFFTGLLLLGCYLAARALV